MYQSSHGSFILINAADDLGIGKAVKKMRVVTKRLFWGQMEIPLLRIIPLLTMMNVTYAFKFNNPSLMMEILELRKNKKSPI